MLQGAPGSGARVTGPRGPAQNTDEVRARATRKVAARVAPAVMLSRVARSEACFTDMVFSPDLAVRRNAGDESSAIASRSGGEGPGSDLG